MTDSSTYGGPGVYGAVQGQGLYGGPIGSATIDVSVGLPGGPRSIGCDWRELTVQRGRSDYLAAFSASQAAVELFGQGGDYSAWNPRGLWAQASPGTPYRTDVPISFTVALGGAAPSPLFAGTTDAVSEDWPDWTDDRVRVNCSDGFKALARARLAAGTVLPSERSGARVTRLLNLASWAGGRQLDAGLVTLASTTLTADTSIADLLRIVGETEWGWLYLDRSNAVVFRQRDAYQTDPRMTSPQWYFTDTHSVPGACYADLTLVANDDLVYNQVNLTLADGSGTVRSAQSAASVAWYGPRPYNRADLPLANAADADGLAGLILAYYADYERRIDTVTFEATSQGDLGLAIAGNVRMNDRIRVYRGLADGYTVAADLLVQGIRHTLIPSGVARQPASWEVALSTARALDLDLWGHWDAAKWDRGKWGP